VIVACEGHPPPHYSLYVHHPSCFTHSYKNYQLISFHLTMGGSTLQAERSYENTTPAAAQFDMDVDDTMVNVSELQKLGVNAAGRCDWVMLHDKSERRACLI